MRDRGGMSQALTKAALITGAARGIGLATARRFIAEGWRVALLDIDEATLDRGFTALRKSEENDAGAIMAICCDVADPAGVARSDATAEQKCCRQSALVNNASIPISKPIPYITY